MPKGKIRHESLLAPRALPMFSVSAWWLVCLSLYVLGWPIAYTGVNQPWVVILFAASLIFTVLGYMWGSRGSPKDSIREAADLEKERIPPLVRIGFFASVALLPLQVATYSGYGMTEVVEAIRNQDLAYALATKRIEEGLQARGSSVILQTLASPFILLALPYLSLQWFERRAYAFHCIVLIGTSLWYSVLVGRNQQIGVTILTLVSTWLLSRGRRNLPLSAKTLILPALAGTVATLLFDLRKAERISGALLCSPGAEACNLRDYGRLEGPFVSVAGYATQGFEGLGRAMQGQWEFGGGVSHSPALRSMTAQTNPFANSTTITDQLSLHGWSDTDYWSTGLAALANDIPWVLIPALLVLVGFLLGSSTAQARVTASPLSVGTYSATWTYLFFMPQNLQLALSGPLYLGFLALVAAYLVSRGRTYSRTQSALSSKSAQRIL